ncbi:hypothetical protein AAC387_Pa07g3580 [Persea americana]
MTVTASVESRIQEISFTEEELEAAEILMQFSDSNFMLCWGKKKKRTRVIWSTFINNRLKTDLESPVTPPSFSTSDTDSKSKQSRRITRVFKKKNHTALKETVSELLIIQQQLKHDISKVRDYYEKLKAENLQLKSRQLELGLYQRREQFDLKSCKDRDFFEEPTEDFNPAFEEKQASIIIQSPIIHQPCERSADQEKQAPIVHHPYEPLVFYPGSHDINPLNDEAAKRDIYKSAIAAQARKRRLQLNRAKSYTALKKPC